MSSINLTLRYLHNYTRHVIKYRAVVLILICMIMIALYGCDLRQQSHLKNRISSQSEMKHGRNLLNHGYNAQAMKAFGRAVELAPSRFDACVTIAAILLSKDMYAESIPYFEKAIAIPPGSSDRPDETMDNIWDSELYLSIGGAYYGMGRIEDAENAYREALKLNPKNSTAYNDWGYMYADNGIKLDEALKLTKRAVEMRPREGAYVDSLGWALFKKGRNAEALKTLIKAAKLSPSEVEIRYHLGMAYESNRQLEAAFIEYRKALLLEPSHKPTLKQIRDLHK